MIIKQRNNMKYALLILTLITTLSIQADAFIYKGQKISDRALQTELEKQSYHSIFSSFFSDQAKRNLAVLAAVQCYRNINWPDKSDRKVLQEILDMHASGYYGQRTQLAAQYYVITRSNQPAKQQPTYFGIFGCGI